MRMILTTTPTIEGSQIREYKGIVTGETIIGANVIKDFFAGIRDIIVTRNGGTGGPVGCQCRGGYRY